MARAPLPSRPREETALLVGAQLNQAHAWAVADSLEELALLCKTAGLRAEHRIICRLARLNAATFIGKGKAQELAEYARAHQLTTVVFDDNLSPAQGRNLEKGLGARVLDRTQIILDIFGQHAKTHEGRMQVELAQLEYLLPRLKRMWTHLERQKGGTGGIGGPGEQQIELDRRRILERITRHRRELEQLRRRRAELRRGRRRHGWALISLVGYTNAGKSTLLNALTGADVPAYDQLFATLDPTTRQLKLPNHQPALMTDTVGFIRKLPHNLVEAFKATLEEVVEADVLVHVIDAAHPQVDLQIEGVNQVLKELGAHDKPIIYALNKIDQEAGLERSRRLAAVVRPSVAVSALRGDGLDQLRVLLADNLRERGVKLRLRIPLREGKLLSRIRAAGSILGEEVDDSHVAMSATIPEQLIGACKPYAEDD